MWRAPKLSQDPEPDGSRETRTGGRIPVQSWKGRGFSKRHSWPKSPCKVTSLLCDRREVASRLWAVASFCREGDPITQPAATMT